jgi:hypothetical protein
MGIHDGFMPEEGVLVTNAIIDYAMKEQEEGADPNAALIYKMLCPARIRVLVEEGFLVQPPDLVGDYILTATGIARTFRGVENMSFILLKELEAQSGEALDRFQKVAANNEFERKIKTFGFKKLGEDNEHMKVGVSVDKEVWTIHGRGIGKFAYKGEVVVKFKREQLKKKITAAKANGGDLAGSWFAKGDQKVFWEMVRQ